MQIQVIKTAYIHLEELQALSRQTFSEAFSSGNTEENMRQYLDKEFSEEKLRQEISNPDSDFYFARLDALYIGYLKINFGRAQTELRENNGMEIERIYVLKEFYGKQAGQLLFNKALGIARERKKDYIWLGVWEKNSRAIRFYEKNGFVQFGTHGFRVGEEEQTDILMKRRLKG
jgi:ribosomal protein S18 acetylase RimI-like enzyme